MASASLVSDSELARCRVERQPSPAMNRLRIVGVVVVAVLAAWFALRSCTPEAPPPPPAPAPEREAFHASKPLRVEIVRTSADGNQVAEQAWLLREIRFVLARGRMKVAPLESSLSEPKSPPSPPFTLRVALNSDATQADLALVAPDGMIERNATIPLAKESQLATMQSLAQRLPQFLGAPTRTGDWTAAMGTSDPTAYDAFLRASDELLSPTAAGFSAPPQASPDGALTLEQVETLARRHRDFPRARALLALGYLSVGGEDQASLAKLAETAAERALAADAQLADAQAALGIVRLRRMEWNAAQEHFEAALALDASSLPALEGLGCLLMDVGRAGASLPIATRAASLQPGNLGARECATYALIATQLELESKDNEPADIARIHGSVLLLAGDRTSAENLLRTSRAAPDELIQSVIGASVDKNRIPEALQIITRNADDEAIDAATELLFGAALRRPDFVFNRMLRLAKQNEAVPLRVLWLPQTDFLRKHRRFKEVVSAASLTTYWQDHGLPDVCAAEPKVHGCTVKRAGAASSQ
jgi:tetratricopeptide (TPR) repeat protein